MRLGVTAALLACVVACAPHASVETVPRIRPLPKPEPLSPQRVHVRSTRGPVIELRASFRAGSADDPPGLEGLTALTARVMVEGAAGGVSFAARQRHLYPMAAQIRVQVSREQTTFVARVHRDHLEAFYPLWIATLLEPAFAEPDVVRVREQQRVELVQGLRGTDDEALGKALLQAMVFQDHPYAHPELGSEAGLRAIDARSLRQQRARVLCASRLQVALAGSVPDGFVDRLRRDLAELHGPRCEAATPAPPVPGPLRGRRVWIADKHEARSVAVSMGFPIGVTRAHPDYPALVLAAAYLGQHRTFAGVLMQKIRGERGLNYGDYAYAEHFEQYGATRFAKPNVALRRQYFSIWLRPLDPAEAHFAIRAAVRELERLAAGRLSQEDFARIQRFMDGYLALYGQTQQLVLGHTLDDLFYGVEGPYLEKLRISIAELTRERVVKAAREHLSSDHLQIALVAPNAAELAEALAGDVPSPIVYATNKPRAVREEDGLIAVYPLSLDAERVQVIPVRALFASGG